MTPNWTFDNDGDDWVTHTRLRPMHDCSECSYSVYLRQLIDIRQIDLRLTRGGHEVSHIHGRTTKEVLEKAAASVDPTLSAWLLSLIDSAPKFWEALEQHEDSGVESAASAVAASAELKELRERIERLESLLAILDDTTTARLDEISAALHGAAALFENVQ